MDELLTTSDEAYSKVNVTNNTTIEKEDGDIDGPFAVAVAVSETIEADESDAGETKEAQLVYVTTAGLLDDTINSVVADGNYDFFMNGISWMSGETSTVSIPEKSLTYTSLMVNAGSANMWGILLIAVLPLAILGIGVAVWIRRRRR